MLAYSQAIADVTSGWTLLEASSPDFNALMAEPALAGFEAFISSPPDDCEMTGLGARFLDRYDEIRATSLAASIAVAQEAPFGIYVLFGDTELADHYVDTPEPGAAPVPVFEPADDCEGLEANLSVFLTGSVRYYDTMSFADWLAALDSIFDPVPTMQSAEALGIGLGCDVEATALNVLSHLMTLHPESIPAKLMWSSMVANSTTGLSRLANFADEMAQPSPEVVVYVVIDPFTGIGSAVVMNPFNDDITGVAVVFNDEQIVDGATVEGLETAIYELALVNGFDPWRFTYSYTDPDGSLVESFGSEYPSTVPPAASDADVGS